MSNLPGMERPALQALPQIGDRLTLKLPRCVSEATASRNASMG